MQAAASHAQEPTSTPADKNEPTEEKHEPTEDQHEPTEEEMDAAIAAAVSCPCIKDLREGPCGTAFVDAFACFHKSKSTPKGNDCYDANVAFMECLKKHPAALDELSDGGTLEKLNQAESELQKHLATQ